MTVGPRSTQLVCVACFKMFTSVLLKFKETYCIFSYMYSVLHNAILIFLFSERKKVIIKFASLAVLFKTLN